MRSWHWQDTRCNRRLPCRRQTHRCFCEYFWILCGVYLFFSFPVKRPLLCDQGWQLTTVTLKQSMLISQHQIFCHAYSSPNSNLWCKQECDVGPKAGIFRTEGLAMAAPAMKPMKPMGLVRPNQLRGLSEKGDIFPPTIITIRWWFQRLFLAFSTPFFSQMSGSSTT